MAFSRVVASTIVSLTVLAGCAERIAFERETSDSPVDRAQYASAEQSGAALYRVDPGASFVLVRVGRSGRMAHLGHDHAVASESLEGYVALFEDDRQSHADIAMPLKTLLVDVPSYRERLGFDEEPSADDIAGTYSNMRRTLDAETYPWARAEARFAFTQPGYLSVSITLHGARQDFVVPVTLVTSEQKVTVGGNIAIDHSQFGLTPFSAAGGLLRVAETLDVEFQVVAKRTSTGARDTRRDAP